MTIRSSAALLILLWNGPFAMAGDTANAPTNGLFFPESVERAMIGEGKAAAATNKIFGIVEISGGSLNLEGATVLPLEPSTPDLNPDLAKRKPAELSFLPYSNPPPSKRLVNDYPELKEAVQAISKGRLDEALRLLHGTPRVDRVPPSEYSLIYLIYDEAGQPTPARLFS